MLRSTTSLRSPDSCQLPRQACKRSPVSARTSLRSIPVFTSPILHKQRPAWHWRATSQAETSAVPVQADTGLQSLPPPPGLAARHAWIRPRSMLHCMALQKHGFYSGSLSPMDVRRTHSVYYLSSLTLRREERPLELWNGWLVGNGVWTNLLVLMKSMSSKVKDNRRNLYSLALTWQQLRPETVAWAACRKHTKRSSFCSEAREDCESSSPVCSGPGWAIVISSQKCDFTTCAFCTCRVGALVCSPRDADPGCPEHEMRRLLCLSQADSGGDARGIHSLCQPADRERSSHCAWSWQ